MVQEWRLLARDIDLNVIDEVSDYQTFRTKLAFNDVGSWSLRLHIDAPQAPLFVEGAGILLQRNGVTVSSGVIDSLEETADALIVTGSTDEVVLEDMLALPNLTAPFTNEYDYREGTASTVMRQFVTHNTGVDADTNRHVTLISFPADPGIGTTVYGRGRWQPLIELLRELAVTGGGLRFRLTHSDVQTTYRWFYVEATEDLSRDVVFAPQHRNLRGWKRIKQAPGGNYAYALGQGIGVDRPVVERADWASITRWRRRREVLADTRETTETAELNQKAVDLLENSADISGLVIEAVDTPGSSFLTDYNLGDLVTGIVRGQTYTAMVREVEIALDPDGGATIMPTLGTLGISSDDPATMHARSLARRVSNLERNNGIPSAGILRDMLTPTERALIGEVKSWAGSALPDGYLWCDGSAVSRSTYSALFDAIGVTWGAGNGSTTFNVPNLQGRFLLGAASSPSYPLASTGGAASINIRHDHGGLTGPANEFESLSTPAGGNLLPADGAEYEIGEDLSTTQSIMPPYAVIHHIIYTGV